MTRTLSTINTAIGLLNVKTDNSHLAMDILIQERDRLVSEMETVRLTKPHAAPIAEPLTKREQFAMAALQGIIVQELFYDSCGLEWRIETTAVSLAVSSADALITELAKPRKDAP